MIKQKFLEVLLWIKEHFRFLVEVVIRLSVGIEKQENPHDGHDEDVAKGEDYD